MIVISTVNVLPLKNLSVRGSFALPVKMMAIVPHLELHGDVIRELVLNVLMIVIVRELLHSVIQFKINVRLVFKEQFPVS